MIEYIDECVGCADSYPCIASCKCKSVPHLICDFCKQEAEVLFRYESNEICQECLHQEFEQITYDDLDYI